MLIDIDRRLLLTTLAAVGDVIDARHAMPVYRNVKAVATAVAGDAHALTLMATDLELSLRLTAAGPGLKVDRPGSALWPADQLGRILREAKDDGVRIDADPRRTEVVTMTSDYRMPAEDPAAFADLSDDVDAEDAGVLAFAAGDLLAAVKFGVLAANRDEGKYAMNTLLIAHAGRGDADVVGTDGKRLSLAAVPCRVPSAAHEETALQALIPRKTAHLLAKLLAGAEADSVVLARLRSHDAAFKVGAAVLTTRLIEGAFPPYRTVVPKKLPVKVEFAAGALLAGIRQAAIMADDESKKIVFAFAPGELTLRAEGPTTGKSKVVLPCPGYADKGLTVNFDPVYLTEYLRELDPAEVVTFEAVSGEKSVVLRTGPTHLYLVVPLV